jgi:methylglutaconyl-CoA hydratase
MSPVLRTERDGVVARVTLTRPEVRNAFNAELIEALRAAFASLAAEPPDRLRAVLLAGEGSGFCAGADIAWMRESVGLSPADNERDAAALRTMLETIETCPVPVITRVHGAALGGGMGLCAVSDVVLATRDTIFGFTETKLGILPAVIAPFVLTKIGESHARALFPTGERFGAERARQIGLVHDVIADTAALDERLAAILDEVLSAGPTAMRSSKALVRELRALSPSEARAHTIRHAVQQRTSPEGQEGLSAFIHKRPPTFKVDR